MRVGSDLEAICGKCGEVWHVVIALEAGRIAKVECKQCGARHRYRAVGAGAPARRGSTSGSGSRSRSRRKAPVVEADTSRPPRAFSTTEAYQAGDRVVHSAFGKGVVQALRGASKIVVLFDEGLKTLVHRRS